MGMTDGRGRREKLGEVASLEATTRKASSPRGLLSDWPPALVQSVLVEATRRQDLESLRVLTERPWLAWRQRALEAGISEELAALGCEAMRESLVRCRDEDARIECDMLEGEAMIDFALLDPIGAEDKWSQLLETGGKLSLTR